MEIREDLIVSPKGGKPTKRTAHLIKPVLSLADSTPELPTTSLPLRPISLECTINGWRTPNQQWISWVDRLHSSYQFIWKRAGIYEAILSSKYKIVKNDDLFFGLGERWCCETNTFVFPWGEATITLEDIAVLGGYSVLGDSVSGSIDFEDYAETEKKLMDVHQEFSKGSSHKAYQSVWMKHFMDLGVDSGIEHEAFLSLWLSRFVLPTFPFDVIVKRFFKIAICLARGVAIALAPVVLASIYRDLSLLKSGIATFSNCSSTQLNETGKDGFDDLVKVTLWAPLQLVQVWAWERFPEFRPKPNLIEFGEPRLARWHDVNVKEVGNVRPLLQSAGNSFEWRPYCKNVDNFPSSIFYQDTEQWVVLGDCLGEGIGPMVRFLRVCELVGMDTTEQYNPNRVAMQFGFDQEVPKNINRDLMNSDIPKRDLVRLAWLSYTNPIKDEILHIPSKFYEPMVTLRYLKWLRQGVLARHAAFDGIVRKKRSNKRSRKLHELRNPINAVDNSVAVVDDIDVKPNIIGDHLDVPPGLMALNAGNQLDVPPDVPPGFTPKSTVAHVASSFWRNSNSIHPTTFCVEKSDEYISEPRVKIKRESDYSIEKENPMLMCGYQTLPAMIGLTTAGSLMTKAEESSGKTEQVKLSLKQERTGNLTENSHSTANLDLEARLKQLERKVAELTQAR
ncbi:Serine/threonine-protein phosphatase 7 long form-like protein [Bienertia sinuspersici]